jgi:hypothetical protein
VQYFFVVHDFFVRHLAIAHVVVLAMLSLLQLLSAASASLLRSFKQTSDLTYNRNFQQHHQRHYFISSTAASTSPVFRNSRLQ